MNRILITGGLGYLGSRIAKEFVKNTTNQITVSTRQKTPPSEPWSAKLQTCSIDLGSSSALGPALQDKDSIIHLLAMNEIDCAKNPEGAMLTNTFGTQRLLQEVIKQKAKRFIYFSTAHIYGENLKGHVTEDTLPLPTHPYATSHLAAEKFVNEALRRKEILGIVVRLTNGFGAPAHPQINRWTLLVNDLCRQAVTSKRLVLRSDGSQIRDFIPISEVIRATEHLLSLNISAIGDGIFNLGSGLSMRIIDMVERIAERCQMVLGFRPEIILGKGEERESPPLQFDISKISKSGFSIQLDFNQEIDETLSFCANHFSGR